MTTTCSGRSRPARGSCGRVRGAPLDDLRIGMASLLLIGAPMPQERLSMRKIRDVLRLSAGGLSKRQIAASLGVSPTAAGDCIRRARQAGLAWPLPDTVDDTGLEARLYPPPPRGAKGRRPPPDWP